MSEKLKSLLGKYKYSLVVLLIGIALMLIPSKTEAYDTKGEEDLPLQAVLSCTEGVGEVKVIVSEKGVVVVCKGADSSKVRRNIILAVNSYTGFPSDRITVLKMN